MGAKVVGSDLGKDDGFLWVIKICCMHFLQRGSLSHVVDLWHVKEH
jgi:hypothetical protein